MTTETLDTRANRVAMAIGNAVVGAAALEKILLGEIARRHVERGESPSLAEMIAPLEGKPAGLLLKKLHSQEIDSHLEERLRDLIRRRNRLVHGFLDDLDVAASIKSGDGIDIVIEGVEQIAMDCAELIAELHPLAERSMEERTGKTQAQLAEWFSTVDLNVIPDPAVRAEVEQARRAMKLIDWPNPPLLSDKVPDDT